MGKRGIKLVSHSLQRRAVEKTLDRSLCCLTKVKGGLH